MENVDYIEFLDNSDAVENMKKEYDELLNGSEGVTNICTIIEYMCNKRIANKKMEIACLVEKLCNHSLYFKYAEIIEKIKKNLDMQKSQNFTFDFEIGKNFIKTLHKIETIEESIIMELEALISFFKDKLVIEQRILILIKNLLITYYLDNGTNCLQLR